MKFDNILVPVDLFHMRRIHKIHSPAGEDARSGA
jgi:hypothetical protein